MYITVSRFDFIDEFKKFHRDSNFSREGLHALFDYLEEYEESTGEKIELDPISLCCEFNEEKIENVLSDYNLECLEDLMNETEVIWHSDTRVLYKAY